MARRSAPAAPAGPNFVDRLLGTFVKWVAWCVVGAFVYGIVALPTSLAVHRLSRPLGSIVGLIVYNTGSTFILASLVLAMVFMPYGFVIWGNPKLRFLGESTPWATGAVRASIAGALIGLVLGLTWHR